MEQMEKKKKYAVILAGGGGTRLWPMSRSNLPKQFLKVNSDGTLLQETFKRLAGFIPYDNILIIAPECYLEEIKKELPKIKKTNILIEISPKNTAAAIAMAVFEISKRDSSAVVGSFASDHLIQDSKNFASVLDTAYLAANTSENLVTIGVVPTKGDTGLGYIHVGKQQREINSRPVFDVKKFTEKPNIATAAAFVASGEYFWNASYFVGRVSTFLESYRKYMPEVLELSNWQSFKDIAIDYGIMEKSTNLSMVTGDFGWSDVGNWQVLSEVFPKNAEGNVFLGETQGKNVMIDSKNCLLYGGGKLIATIGVSDLVIVESKDAILVCQKDKAQDVKKIVERLQNKNKKSYL